jgi:spore photoproduct lyase
MISIQQGTINVEEILKRFEKEYYNIKIVNCSLRSNCKKGLIIKASKQGLATIFLSVIPCLDGHVKVSVFKVSDGSIIERFTHTKFPPKDSSDIVCPHFLELKWAYGCPFNCSYCYLQGTLRLLPTQKRPMRKEIIKVKHHIISLLSAPLNEPEILNSGELCDSLMYEGTELSISSDIIPLFEDTTINKNKHRILLVTKSNKIENLLRSQYARCTIASFSINTERVFTNWEKGTAHPSSRIKAAKSLFDAGFEVRIRIDPIIPFPQETWKSEYLQLIDEIFKQLWPSRITLGSLRGLSTTLRKAEDKTWISFLEDSSNWGYRPNYKLRFDAYQAMIDYLLYEYDYRDVALCKEPVQMWQDLGMDWRECRCNCVW